ncbi:MAG TPA: hypothetical protein VM819_10045 [Vicinamibacterales bacterium]|nr:hypothetical protein [Vicinamibacterales bacterium]
MCKPLVSHVQMTIASRELDGASPGKPARGSGFATWKIAPSGVD